MNGTTTRARSVVFAATFVALATSVPAQAAPSISDAIKRDAGRNSCYVNHVTKAGPVGGGTCSGVRPGAVILTPIGQCTMAFAFRGSDHRDYISTAGHCVLGANGGEKRWLGLRRPSARDGHGYWIGNFVYAVFSWTDIGPTYDFAVVRLNPWIHPTASMCHFGGPDGLYTKHEPTPSILRYFGESPTWRGQVPARSAVALDTTSPNYVLAVAESDHGDSGSGVINQRGEAVGVLTGGHIASQFPDTVFARLDMGVARAQRALHIRLGIRNARVSPDSDLSL